MFRSFIAIAVISFLYTEVSFAQARDIRPRISDEHLVSLARWLRLTEDQVVLVRDFHRTYSETYEVELLPAIREYGEHLDQVNRRVWEPGASKGALSRQLYPQIEREYEALIGQVDALEDSFKSNVLLILTEEQRQFVPRMERGLVRVRAERDDLQLPEGNIDLVDLIDGLGLSASDYSAVEAAFLNEYEPEYIRLLLESHDAFIARRIAYWDVYDIQYRIETEDLNEWEKKQLRDEAADIEKRIGRPRIAAAERLVEFNRRSLARLLEVLTAEQYGEIHRRYYASAYPELYPDPTSADILYAAALAIEGLDADQREAIEALYVAWSSQYDAMSESMAEAVFYRYWSTYAGRPSRIGNGQDLWEVLKERGYEREALNARQIQPLRGLLTAEQFETLPEWDFEKNPPRRRWDREYERLWEHEQRVREIERLQRESGGQ